MAKEYVIFYTEDLIIVPIKAATNPYNERVAYCATYPQFFGGGVGVIRGVNHTLAGEVTEESQGQLILPVEPEPEVLIHEGANGEHHFRESYTFKKALYTGVVPEAFIINAGRPAAEREMQAILRITREQFQGIFTPDKLVDICRSINPAYCSSEPGGVNWNNDWGTKNAFQAFLGWWNTMH